MFIKSFVLNIKYTIRRNVFKTPNFQPLLTRFLSTNIDEIEVDEKDERDYQEIAAQYFTDTLRNNCYLIHPYVKWGPQKVRDTNPEQQLAEAVSLIRTLEPWRVCDSIAIPLHHLEKKTLFSSGNLEKLKRKIRGDPEITSVFINKGTLKSAQKEELEHIFQVPVYDRYNIVMLILKRHAISKHAKLQVALAEVLYVQSRQKKNDNSGISYETRKLMLQKREQKIRKAIEKLRNQREHTRMKRKEKDYPIVAVVGYTNCGKTSLIKALTQDANLEPRDQLFATLDVTLHAGLLPSKMQVLYVDTVGFISNIPTTLIECFVVTLEDALYSDAILHVEDVASPNLLHQRNHVIATLKNLTSKVSASDDIMDKVITVGNKCDLVENKNIDADILCVSAKTGFGLNELLRRIEEAIVKNTGRCIVSLRVPIGGDEMRWLYKNAVILDSTYPDDNPQCQDAKVIIAPGKLEQFKHYFVKGSRRCKVE